MSATIAPDADLSVPLARLPQAIRRTVAAARLAQLVLENADQAVTKLAGIMLCGSDCEGLLRKSWPTVRELFAFCGCAMLRRMISKEYLPDYDGFVEAVDREVLDGLRDRGWLRAYARHESEQLAEIRFRVFRAEFKPFEPVHDGYRYAGTYGYELGKRIAQALDRPADIGIIGVAASVTYTVVRMQQVADLMRPLYEGKSKLVVGAS